MLPVFMQLTADQKRLWHIFHPKAAEEEARIRRDDVRFVHYTRAETALKILHAKEFWMRKTTCMTDFSEVKHGLKCLRHALSGGAGLRFIETLNGMFSGIGNNIAAQFINLVPSIEFHTYITCFSEHTKSEDDFGRLSMWRAYAANTGVAIVLKNSAFEMPSVPLNIFMSPVAYLQDSDLPSEFDRVCKNIMAHKEFIQEQGAVTVADCVFRMLYFGSVSIKNPCFREEWEWRLVYSPHLYPSEFLREGCESILGVPQRIYKIPLQDIPGLEPASIIDRIIIGPTQYWDALNDAFTDELRKFGVAQPHVYSSNIPLRS